MSKYGHSEDAYEDADKECDRLMSLLAIAHGDLVAVDNANIENPDSKLWRRHDGALLPFPNGGTRAEWQVIADASYERASHLPND